MTTARQKLRKLRIEELRQEGREAYDAGVPLRDCPYRFADGARWAEGWNSREGKQEATSSEPTKEQKAIGAFLSAMYDCKLDGKRMREAMLGVLGITGAVPDHVEFIDSLKTALPVIESMAKNSPSQWNRDVYGKASDNIRAAIDAAMLKEGK